jgi:hypothetical protein
VLAFSLLLASCGGVDTEDDIGAITGGSSGIWSITAPVTYDSSISSSLLTEAKSKTNFSYLGANNPISNYIPNSSITVSGGKVTIKLGKVPDIYDYLEDMSLFTDVGLRVSDPGAKISTEFYESSTQDGKYWLVLNSTDENKSAGLIYATKDVTITGTFTYTGTYKFNLSLKAGWNYFIQTRSGTVYNRTYTITASQSLPSDFNWTVL